MSSATLPAALRLLSVSNDNEKSSAQETAMFDSKLRRRFAYEWEYLASVLDRVLLIIFSVLVLGVTAAMMIVGEIIHISYDL